MSDLVTRVLELQQAIDAMQERIRLQTHMHFQLMTVLTHQLGGEIIVTPFDFKDVVGVSLSTRKDPVTGDLIFKTQREVPHAQAADDAGGDVDDARGLRSV